MVSEVTRLATQRSALDIDSLYVDESLVEVPSLLLPTFEVRKRDVRGEGRGR